MEVAGTGAATNVDVGVGAGGAIVTGWVSGCSLTEETTSRVVVTGGACACTVLDSMIVTGWVEGFSLTAETTSTVEVTGGATFVTG